MYTYYGINTPLFLINMVFFAYISIIYGINLLIIPYYYSKDTKSLGVKMVARLAVALFGYAGKA